MTAGTDLITAERQRQIEVEGWDANHDRGHSRQLGSAAAVYALPEDQRELNYRIGHVHLNLDLRRFIWPWEERWWKPTPDDRIRELVKAGALIAAAIDDLIRESQP